jgi:hypothetical protein
MPASGEIEIARTVVNNMDVMWDAYAFGGNDKVTLQVPQKLKEIKVGSMGDLVLGHRVLGIENPKITVEVREIDLTFLQAIHPWWTSGAISVLPLAAQQDLYDYAAVLKLHPNHLPVGTVNQDRNYLKAVPMLSDASRDGVADGKDLVDFILYPDRSLFPIVSYGYIGAIPS